VDQQLDETTMTSAKSHLDTALPELIRELGYTFTANVDQCRANLRQLGGGPDIHAATVARIIGVMVRTHTGLDDPTTLQNMNATGMLFRIGKTVSLGPWSRAIVYCSKLSFSQNDPPMGESFWQKESLLEYTMTLLQRSCFAHPNIVIAELKALNLMGSSINEMRF
jgi:hypothetical protein